jgi:hypothetical protein
MMNAKNKALLASYGRTFLAAVIAVYATGNHDAKAILIAGAVATIGPAIRAINPRDPAFGIGADILTLELTKLATPHKRKAVAKKAAK